MADDDDNDDTGPQRSGRSVVSGVSQDGATSGPAMGPIYMQWENSLERLKVLGYESSFCINRSIKPFSRIHFVFPLPNAGSQFKDFIEICQWLFTEIKNNADFFKKDEYDDPNTVANKLMLALRQLDFKLSFPSQKLKTAHGEAACSVLDFLTEKAFANKNFTWSRPTYNNNETVELANDDDDRDADVEDEAEVGVDEEDLFGEAARNDVAEISLDNSSHQILYAQVDPVEWKTELERVGPKLRAQQQLATNEWRAHVDLTITSKGHIERVLTDTQGDLQTLYRDLSEELNKMRTKERYINQQFTTLCVEYKDVKQKVEELEGTCSKTNDRVAKLTNELAEHTERLDELKESFDSRDSGINDTSPLVRMKTALQNIKAEIYAFELRIGVVSHSLLTAKVSMTNRRRLGAAKHAKRRGVKSRNKGYNDDNSGLSGEDDN